MQACIAALILILSLSAPVAAGDPASAWSGLTNLTVDSTPVGEVKVCYPAALANIQMTPAAVEPDGSKRIIVMQTKLTADSGQQFLVVYDEGPSVDPTFMIYLGHQLQGEPALEVFALTLILPGNGQVYAAGHTNNMYDQRRKFVFANRTFQEAVQPFYAVNVSGQLDAPVTLMAERGNSARVGFLPAGSNVDVLLNKDDWYLLRTPFGLTGWARIDPSPAPGSPVIGLYYAGD